MVGAPIVFQARAWHARKDAWERIMRAVSTTGFSLASVIGGALLLEGARSGLYWIAAGDILGIIAVVLSACVDGRDSALRTLPSSVLIYSSRGCAEHGDVARTEFD
jgi:hypothetical protein